MLQDRNANSCTHRLDQLEGNAQYCPDCGQHLPVRRIDWAYLKEVVRNDILSLERGLPHTLVSLFVRPGYLIRDYLEGRRAGIVKPFSLLLITAAAALLIAEFFLKGDIMSSELQKDAMAGVLAGDAKNAALHGQLSAALNRVGVWLNQHFTLVTFLVLPIEAWCMKLAFKGFKQYNYPEWLVIASFLTVQTFVIWCVLMPLMVAWPGVKQLLMPASIVIGVFSFVQIFQPYPKWKAVLRGVWAFAFMQIVVYALMVVVGIVLAMRIAAGV